LLSQLLGILRIGDSLDVFGVHARGGIGSLLVAVFALPALAAAAMATK
jgi:ammonia channel protein AmtB